MVDMSTYNTLHSTQADGPHDQTSSGGDSIGQAAMNAKEPPGDDFLLTLPAKVPGFGFHNKRWGMSNYRDPNHKKTNTISRPLSR